MKYEKLEKAIEKAKSDAIRHIRLGMDATNDKEIILRLNNIKVIIDDLKTPNNSILFDIDRAAWHAIYDPKAYERDCKRIKDMITILNMDTEDSELEELYQEVADRVISTMFGTRRFF